MHMLRKFTKCHQQSRVFNGVAAAPLVCIFECLEFLWVPSLHPCAHDRPQLANISHTIATAWSPTKKCTNSKGLLMMYSAFEDKTRKSLRGIMGDVHSHKHATGAAVRREWWNWKTERHGHYPSLWSDDFNIGALFLLFEQSLLDSSVYNVPNRCPDHILCPRVGSTSGMCCQQRFQWENRNQGLLRFVTFVRALRWMLIAAGQVHDIFSSARRSRMEIWIGSSQTSSWRLQGQVPPPRMLKGPLHPLSRSSLFYNVLQEWTKLCKTRSDPIIPAAIQWLNPSPKECRQTGILPRWPAFTPEDSWLLTRVASCCQCDNAADSWIISRRPTHLLSHRSNSCKVYAYT